MAFAAVPKYLGNDYRTASPGLRFGLYFEVWGQDERSRARLWTTHDVGYESRGQPPQERSVDRENKVGALERVAKLNPTDLQLLKALVQRQRAQFQTWAVADRYALQARSTSPFTTGLGIEHPLENGFAFLSPYGLPYLPGSGIKGVLRQAARELASGDWGDNQGWDDAAMKALFGSDQDLREQDAQALRGALCCWDVLPQPKDGKLAVEIMTPHFGHYYQQQEVAVGKGGRQPQQSGTVNPHESGQPTPLPFLCVPPGSDFAFHLTCNSALLRHRAPALADGRWRELLTAAAQHAFVWLGFGAKTAVGYGAMYYDQEFEAKLEEQQREARERQERERRLAEMSPRERQVEDYISQMREVQTKLRGKTNKPNGKEHQQARELARTALNSADWTVDEKRALAEAIEHWLPKVVRIDPKDLRKELKLNQLRGSG